MGGKTGSVSEVTAEMTEVAGQRDIINKVYKGASTVSAKMEQGVLAGTYFGTLRVLGFMADAASALKLNFKYADGTTSTTTVDISTQTETFNEDKQGNSLQFLMQLIVNDGRNTPSNNEICGGNKSSHEIGG